MSRHLVQVLAHACPDLDSTITAVPWWECRVPSQALRPTRLLHGAEYVKPGPESDIQVTHPDPPFCLDTPILFFSVSLSL